MEKITKKLIKEKLERFIDYIPYSQDSDTLYFVCCGGDINTPNYRGDIFNYRIVASLLLNGLKIVVEVGATRTRRTLHKTTKRPIIHPVEIYDDNGIIIEYSCEDVPQFEKSFYYGYQLTKTSFRTETEWIKDDLEEDTSYHTTKNILKYVNSELKTHFKKIVLVDNGYYNYLTINEALKDEYIRNFDDKPLMPSEEITLTYRAKKRFEMLQICGVIDKSIQFENEYCWITSSSLQGIYFPNLNNNIRCFVFGVYGRVITCLNDEE